MDTDTTNSILALAASLIIFGLSEVAVTAISIHFRACERLLSLNKLATEEPVSKIINIPAGPTAPLRLINIISVASTIMSTSAFVISIAGVQWIMISLAVAIILGFLGIVRSMCLICAKRWTKKINVLASPTTMILSYLLYPILIFQSMISKMFSLSDNSSFNTIDAQTNGVNLRINPELEAGDHREVKMIRAVIELNSTVAREIMVPRVDIHAAESGIKIRDLAEQMVKSGHSRLPIYEGDLDHINGIAHARDILQHLTNGQANESLSAGNATKPTLFIPESKSLIELLHEFQTLRVHLAVVIDEYGGVSGIVTFEDLLEEIVGEIQDEFDANEDVTEIKPIGNNQYLIDAGLSIDQLNTDLNVSLKNTGFDTVGGFVFERLGKIPSVGDRVDHECLGIEVLSTVGRRLKNLRVTLL